MKSEVKYIQKGVYQHLGASLKSWMTPKCWSTPRKNIIFLKFVKNLYFECQMPFDSWEKCDFSLIHHLSLV